MTPRKVVTSVQRQVVGGGLKKVLYTLAKVREMGVARATKTLVSNNTCKACGLGMGGQLGGMTNELGEFPSVCNKSVQAQSTDTQPSIPNAIFGHTISELKELNERELASLGRLNTPLFKAAAADRFTPIDWRMALFLTAERLKRTDPARSFFYSSGRSSNEAGFVLQLFARLFGTNNINNCSYYCHQATGVALGATIGSGTATVELSDLAHCDLIFVVGANPASNHPRLLHQLKACRDRGGDVIVINPAREPGLVKFAVPKSPGSMIAGGTEIASLYLQPNIGTDQMLLAGIAKAVLASGNDESEYIDRYTTGFSDYAASLVKLPWSTVVRITGVSEADIKRVADRYIQSENAVFAWGMGLTHHIDGVGNIEQLANLALMRGMVGKVGAGLLPLRGHSNVQGIGTIGVKPVLAAEVLSAMEAHFNVKLPSKPGLDTMGAMQAASAGDMDFAWLMGGNLYASNPDSYWAAEALSRMQTKVFLTTTMNGGHVHGSDGSEAIILPVTARDEEWQPTTQESMFNYVRLSDGGIERQDNVRPESWILAEVASQVLGRSPIDFSMFQEHREVRQAIAKIIPEMSELADIDVAKEEFHIQRRILHTPSFATSSGKAAFVPVSQPEQLSTHFSTQDVTHPFVMATVRSEGQFNSIVYEDEDVYRQTTSRWCVLMCPEDMERLELTAGDVASLVSDAGQMDNVAVVPFDIPPGNCMTYYPEANILTGTTVDPRSRTPSFKSTPVTILPNARH